MDTQLWEVGEKKRLNSTSKSENKHTFTDGQIDLYKSWAQSADALKIVWALGAHLLGG